ncbi:MAG: hypothetical protein NWR36_04150, partial [Opitutales bacterium]|nr:hypothetical protein [Opitutales bacterium]
AGNKPDANGRIYAQAIRVEFTDQYDNPAKLESLALYATQTGEVPPHDISTMNRHWKDKTFSYIQENRGQWIGLMFRKAYYFLNSYEQYDNKTYGFHKPQHLQLKINPIHWGAPYSSRRRHAYRLTPTRASQVLDRFDYHFCRLRCRNHTVLYLQSFSITDATSPRDIEHRYHAASFDLAKRH